MGALGWVTEVIETLGAVIPRLVLVRATERAIFFKRGAHLERGPGLHVYWPVWTEVEIHPVVRQVLPVATQPLTTRDGETVAAGGVLVYNISSLTVFMVENHEAEDNLAEVAEAAVRDVVTGSDFARIQKHRTQVNAEMCRAGGERLERYGVECEELYLTAFARTTCITLQGDAGFVSS